jgi:site-specific DNA recombinase
MVENRGAGNAHEQFDIPLPRDGSIADLLAEATRPDRRFVAVVCESIERIARVTYFSTKIEYELEQAGVALLAADEGIDAASIPSLNDGSSPFRRATPTLTRRVKQAIAEWYVLNMLELSWGGLKAHTSQGYNIGKPPYGHVAGKLRHPVKAKAHEGKTKHRLIPDPVRGPVVTQIFLWRAVHRLGYDEIATRLNLDPDRYPPPDPILGEGRRRIGAWTGGSVREVLDNPKHTGYMVWNRRKRGHRARGVKGRVNPPTAWVWSPQPTHEPLVTREIFAAASTVGRFRQGSRSGSGHNTHPKTTRTYLLRSYVRCDLCGRRANGETTKGYTYYRCSPNPKNHGHLPWFPGHPRAALVAEGQLIEPLARFFAERVFGASRKRYLTAVTAGAAAAASSDLAARRAEITAAITDLKRRQQNLINELERLQPSGDPDADEAWRRGIQNRFTATVAEQRQKKQLLADLAREGQATAPADVDMLDLLPQRDIDVRRLPEDQQRDIYDAFHLELRYNRLRKDLTIRATITADTAQTMAAAAETISGERQKAQQPGSGADPDPGKGVWDVLSAPPGTRTPNPRIKSPLLCQLS